LACLPLCRSTFCMGLVCCCLAGCMSGVAAHSLARPNCQQVSKLSSLYINTPILSHCTGYEQRHCPVMMVCSRTNEEGRGAGRGRGAGGYQHILTPHLPAPAACVARSSSLFFIIIMKGQRASWMDKHILFMLGNDQVFVRASGCPVLQHQQHLAVPAKHRSNGASQAVTRARGCDAKLPSSTNRNLATNALNQPRGVQYHSKIDSNHIPHSYTRIQPLQSTSVLPRAPL